MKKLTTLPEVIAHLDNIKVKMEAFTAEVPDVDFAAYSLKDLQPALMYELQKHIAESGSLEKIEYKNDVLNLWCGYKSTFGLYVMFYSVPVEIKTPLLESIIVTELQEVA